MSIMRVQADIVINDGLGPVANASIKYGGIVKINGYTIWPKYDGSGYIVQPPQNPLAKEGDKYTDKVYGNNRELREMIDDAILAEYAKVKERKNYYEADIHVFKKPKSSGLASADVIFNHELIVKGFIIYINEQDEIEVLMPRNIWRGKDGEWQKGDYILEPIQKELIWELKKRIIEKYIEVRESDNFKKDFIQQIESTPVTFTPAGNINQNEAGKESEKEIGQ